MIGGPQQHDWDPPTHLHKESYDQSSSQMNSREEFNHIFSLFSWIQELALMAASLMTTH